MLYHLDSPEVKVTDLEIFMLEIYIEYVDGSS